MDIFPKKIDFVDFFGDFKNTKIMKGPKGGDLHEVHEPFSTVSSGESPAIRIIKVSSNLTAKPRRTGGPENPRQRAPGEARKPTHDFGDRGIYYRNDVCDNDNDVSDHIVAEQDLGDNNFNDGGKQRRRRRPRPD